MTIRTRHAAASWKCALIGALLAVSAISISCFHTRAARMDAWRGHSIDELIQHWGVPTGTATLKDGRIVYSWTAVDGRGHVHRSIFTTSKDGVIADWSYQDATIPGYPN